MIIQSVPSYQPETAYEIFMRAIFNKDIATGLIDLADDYTTFGPSSTFQIKNEVLPAPNPECYILGPSTCTEEQYALVKNNTALIKNYILIGKEEKEIISSNKIAWYGTGSQKILNGP